MPKVTDAQLATKRQEILAAAMACFARHGFHRTTMADIAAEAGISDGLAYRYFAGKDEIIRAVVDQEAQRDAPSAVEAVGSDDVATILALLLRTSFRRFEMAGRDLRLRLRFRSWAEALDNDDVRAQVIKRWRHLLDAEERLWATAQQQGLIPADLDVRAVVRVMQAIHDGLDVQWLLDPQTRVDRCNDVVMALAFGRFWRDGEARDGQPHEGTTNR